MYSPIVVFRYQDDDFPLLERLLGESRGSGDGSRGSGEGRRGSGEGGKGSGEVNHSGSESTMAAWREQRHDSTDSRWVGVCV